MKLKWKVVLSSVLVIGLLSAVVFATTGTRTAELLYDNIKVSLNGTEIVPKDVNGNAIEPFIIDGTTYLPVRGIASSLGLNVEWDDATNTVVLSNADGDTSKTEFNMGETWTVDGQWAVTIDSVTEIAERNPYSDKNPAAVYLIDYTYTNLGYTSDILDGLYIDFSLAQVVDSTGLMGYSYPGSIENYPQSVPVGATCKAQSCIGVDNAGDFKIMLSEYDGNFEKHSATFNIDVQ